MKYYQSITEIKEKNAAAGRYFFTRSTLKFFNCRVCPTIYGGRYFITRDGHIEDGGSPWQPKRVYVIWEATRQGNIKKVSTHSDLKKAKDTARYLVKSESFKTPPRNNTIAGVDFTESLNELNNLTEYFKAIK